MSNNNFLQQLFGLHGKTAVVIGGTGTLGQEICNGLAGAGAAVIAGGRSVTNPDDPANHPLSDGEILHLELDTTSRDSLVAMVELLASMGRRCDILVNGAGVNSATPFVDISDDEWDRILSINLSGVRKACQVFGQHMLDSKQGGSIINIASLSAITPLSRVFTYSVSKAGVLNLTQNLAREWAPAGIRVNALSPGFLPAEQNRKVLTPDRIENIMRHTPMNRFGIPTELIGAVLLLASSNAGSFITGHNLVVDGGFTAMTI